MFSAKIEELILNCDKIEKICCRHCGSEDYNKRGIQDNRQEYTCKRCNRNFREIYQSDIKDKSIKCQHCQNSDYHKKGKSHSGKRIFHCNICNKNFRDSYTIGVYERTLKCHHCGSSNYVKRGKRGWDDKQQYGCNDCHRTFIENYKIVVRDPELLCHHCGSNNYMKHGYMRSGKQRYLCHDCTRHFAQTYDDVICTHCGSEDYNLAGFNNKIRCYRCQTCHKRFREVYYYKPKSQDYILLSDLGIERSIHRSNYVVAFDEIRQTWLRDLCKKFIYYMAPLRSQGTILNYLKSMRRFSKFLTEHYPLSLLESIDRSIIVHYLQYLGQLEVTLNTRLSSLSNLQKFFEIGNFNAWFVVPSYLIHSEDFSGTKPHPLPRYIPDEVIQQVNQNLDKLYEPVMRMVIVQQEFGLRISELLTLKCYCTEQDSKGQWSLKFFRGKTKREDHLPIVNLEIVRVIQEQQAYIQAQFGDRYEYLFCGNQTGSYNQFRPQPKVMSDSCFTNYLNRFAKVADIRDSSGKLWHFQTHQFRHTVGTRMINNGVPQHIVQRYLGHTSADMTAVYAHIHDKTLRKAAEDFHERVVNVSGNNVNSSNPEIDGNDDLNWIRKQMSAQALPNGYCARPLVKGPCPHANACLTCGDFRTTQEFLEVHRDELQRTEELISMARKNDWQRQVEMNEIVAINLRKMIVSLEAS